MDVRGHLDLLLLAVLADAGPVHGYALIAALRDRSEGVFDLPEGTAAGWAATFTADGVFGKNEGRTALERVWTSTRKDPNRPQNRHWINQLVLTKTADGASGTCYFMIVTVSQNPAVITMSGIYEDTLVKTAEGWRFKQRATR